MNSIAAFSFILHDRHGTDRFARFFRTLADQDIPSCRLEVCLVDTNADSALPRMAKRYRARAGEYLLRVISAPGASPAKAWNLGLKECTGLLAACVQPGLRLDRGFASAHLSALHQHPEADVLFSGFLSSGPLGAGFIRPQGSPQEQLRSLDAIGPLPVLTSRARRALHFREASPFPSWELGIQAAQRGLRFLRLPRLLYSVPSYDWKANGPAEEMARLVTRQAGFFHVDQLRWALGVLRRRAWAMLPECRGLPSPREIRELMHEQIRMERLSRTGQHPVETFPGPQCSLGALGA
ncbi:glycosyltransferase family A protein [Paucidesulfovibrio longus]|uniref:glycosyltransferase family A protein n=1 Tax=Paucidesulfovibrio longus TaxID=889 RepID=UPI0003B4BA13|nr:glycosyltransferase family A protein [Paucidesulfovibrio longus]